jgi:hypothetical protein
LHILGLEPEQTIYIFWKNELSAPFCFVFEFIFLAITVWVRGAKITGPEQPTLKEDYQDQSFNVLTKIFLQVTFSIPTGIIEGKLQWLSGLHSKYLE